ncbi:MAG: hypothetical protein ABI880_01205 [Acidobacteriota bacterium]
MISDLIVWASVALAAVFVAAWAASPALRAWIERPKHRFLEAAQGYDAAASADSPPTDSHTP